MPGAPACSGQWPKLSAEKNLDGDRFLSRLEARFGLRIFCGLVCRPRRGKFFGEWCGLIMIRGGS